MDRKEKDKRSDFKQNRFYEDDTVTLKAEKAKDYSPNLNLIPKENNPQ